MAFAVVALFLLPSLASPVLGLRMEKEKAATLRQWLESEQCVKLDLPPMSSDSMLRLLRDTDSVMFMFSLFQKGLLKQALGMPSLHTNSGTSVLRQHDHEDEHKAKAWFHEDGTWKMLMSKDHHKNDIDTCMGVAATACHKDNSCKQHTEELDTFLNLVTVNLRRNGVLDDLQLEQVVKAWGVHLGYELASFPKDLLLDELGVQSQVAAKACDRVLRITPSWEAHHDGAADAREIVSLVLPSKAPKPNGILRRLHSGKEIMDPMAPDQEALTSAEDLLDQPMRAQASDGQAIHYIVN